jgi:hypothetical protein
MEVSYVEKFEPKPVPVGRQAELQAQIDDLKEKQENIENIIARNEVPLFVAILPQNLESAVPRCAFGVNV